MRGLRLSSALVALSVLAVACGGASARHEEGYHHAFSDVAHYQAVFEGPQRDAWQKPDQVVKLLRIEPGQTIADIGAGTGYFEPRLAAAVGPQGKVLALDIEPKMVAHMEARFAKEKLDNVEPRRVEPDDPGLSPGSVDRILLVDTWHHIDDRSDYAKKLAAALVPGGFVMIVDFTAESPHGPPKAHRLSSEEVMAELEHGGLHPALLAETLPDQYVVVGRR